MIAHWDEIEAEPSELGHIGGRWSWLSGATEAPRVGVNRIQVDPGKWSTPAHIESAEEEIFFVLGGSGWSWQQLGAEGEVRMHEIREGDCIVHLAGRERHTLLAGDDGLDVVAFGNRHPTQFAYLPRGRVGWIGGTWTNAGDGEWPWAREVEAGAPDVVDATERPDNIKREDDVKPAWGGTVYALAQAAGSKQSGLNVVRLAAGGEGAPPHCHSAEEEFFVVLGGRGTLHLEPTPSRREFGMKDEQHEVRRGNVVSRPAGNAVCHSFTASDEGLVYLAYGTRHPQDVIYYPRDNGIWFKGAGVMIAADHISHFGS